MIKEYEVISLSVGAGNKIFHSGDIVKESDFPEGNAKQLENGGYLKFKKEIPEEALPEVPDKDVLMVDDRMETMSIKQIVSDLIKKGIAFDKDSSKAELFAKWKGK